MKKALLLLSFCFPLFCFSQTTQWASSVIGFSSQYGTSNWSAADALGAPNVANCGSNANAWTSATSGGQREWLELGYSTVAPATGVEIHQTAYPGAVDTVYVRNANTGTWNIVYTATAAAVPCNATNRLLRITFPQTSYPVDAVRIAVNSPAVPDWQEIDAVGLIGAGGISSAQSGNWNDASTWAGGVVPGANDTVIVSHSITVNGNFSVKSVEVSSSGTLNLNNAANSLTLGPTGGGKEYLQVNGGLNISNGTLSVNGRAAFGLSSTFTMSGGNLVVDGNNGTSAGSVEDGTHLITLSNSATVNVTGGTVTVVDPQYHANGQAIQGSASHNLGGTVRMGDAASTTSSLNPRGFGGALPFPRFGNLVMEAVTSAGNRQFEPYETVNVTNNVTINSGTLKPTWTFNVGGSLVNNDQLTVSSTVTVSGNTTNNDNIFIDNGQLRVRNDLINSTGATISSALSSDYIWVGEDFVNNGTLSSGWIYFDNSLDLTSPGSQTFGGTGTFSVFGLVIDNNHVGGVSMQVPLTIQNLWFYEGRLFLGNNDLTVTGDPNQGTPGLNNYVATNGTGRLIVQNIGTVPELIPIGTSTSYNPLTIANGGGHTYTFHVDETFTAPPANNSVVQREWTINDLTGGAVTPTITFQWNAADEDPAFNRNESYIGFYNGANWIGVSNITAASGANPYTRQATVSQFGPFGVGSSGAFGAALPVTLTQFKVNRNQQAVRVQWRTDNELNFSHFEVQRSSNGREFTSLRDVPAKPGSIAKEYEMVDASPFRGLNYYRLKMVDLDGTFSYSRIVRVDMARKFTAHIRPNPARHFIFIDGSADFRQIEILDVTGRLVKRMMPSPNERYQISDLKKGAYVVRMIGSDEVQSLRLTIE